MKKLFTFALAALSLTACAKQPYTMTPEQLIEAARIIQPKVLFPYHYSQTDVSGIATQLPDIDVRIRHYE